MTLTRDGSVPAFVEADAMTWSARFETAAGPPFDPDRR